MENKKNQRKGLYIGISLLVALVLWIYVDVYGNPDGSARVISKTIEDVPIEYVGETVLADKGMMLVEDWTDLTTSVKLEGTRWNISWLESSQLRVQADLSEVNHVGLSTVSYRIVFPEPFLSGLLHEVGSSNITVNVAELYGKQVEIRCEIHGKVASNCSAGELQMQETVMEIRGQEEYVDQVAYAKVLLQLENAAETVSQNLRIMYFDKDDNPVDGSKIYSDFNEIQVTLPVNVTKELWLTMNFVEAAGARLENVDYKISPASIIVTGDAGLLQNIETIVLDEFSLLSMGMTMTQFHHSYSIVLPEGCENLSGITRATMEIAYKDMQVELVEATNFQCDNVPEGKEIEFLTTSLPIRIFGKTEDVLAVTKEDIVVRVDLDDFSEASGSYTIPARVTIHTTGDVGISGNYQVRLSILDQTPAEDGSTGSTDNTQENHV